jgi:excisionase family DNA binding protein
MYDKPNDVLTIEELAAYLKIPKSTLYKLVREGKIPSQKIGRHWRFRKGAIDHWLDDPPIESSASAGTRANETCSGGDNGRATRR